MMATAHAGLYHHNSGTPPAVCPHGSKGYNLRCMMPWYHFGESFHMQAWIDTEGRWQLQNRHEHRSWGDSEALVRCERESDICLNKGETLRVLSGGKVLSLFCGLGADDWSAVFTVRVTTRGILTVDEKGDEVQPLKTVLARYCYYQHSASAGAGSGLGLGRGKVMDSASSVIRGRESLRKAGMHSPKMTSSDSSVTTGSDPSVTTANDPSITTKSNPFVTINSEPLMTATTNGAMRMKSAVVLASNSSPGMGLTSNRLSSKKASSGLCRKIGNSDAAVVHVKTRPKILHPLGLANVGRPHVLNSQQLNSC
ncbi:hypothetical protein GQ602_001665 [Ophiocordyceps camponoti-floridani]|uniref:Uncharacterized protein n=1 Tax=Ophiocordyceps camponoti-floridani TaxID=2030778 RepID=A0A8H4Q9B3_9HYPO|nr:hypothetical protein GQ602_001665 [Ophiocordyceps camponoti-floridani]